MKTKIVKADKVLVLSSGLLRKYGVKQGVKIFLEEENDHIKIFPMTKEVIDLNKGFLGKNCNLLKALKKEKHKERGL
jgi:hypothetical protein